MKRDSVGQLLMIGVPGKELDCETAQAFRRVQPGAFILFGRNIETAPQLRKLIDDLRDLSDAEPIITIDQEGGRVSRLRLIGNEPPNAQQLREKGDIDLIGRHGDITGRLLRLFGFNLDLCPVLDISFDDEADNSLRGRCYGRSAQEVIRNAGGFNRAMRATGVASCGKHFPGYSAAGIDAHHELPKIDRTRGQLERDELAVFRAFVRGPAAVDSLMICHGWYPVFDSQKKPASLSKIVVDDLLRREMRFEGLIMTDDLDMGAIVNEYSIEEMISLAFAAGNDVAMVCHRVSEIDRIHHALSQLPGEQIDRALANVARFKKTLLPPTPFSLAEFETIDRQIWDLRVAVLGAERAAERSPEDGKRSPVEMY
jgi:beta-N-acetylhexosaminidase